MNLQRKLDAFRTWEQNEKRKGIVNKKKKLKKKERSIKKEKESIEKELLDLKGKLKKELKNSKKL